MIFNMSGGGSNPLNFKVVGGTTQPSNPQTNTIWVNTSTAITDYVFSTTQPAVASGRVWISTGTESPSAFNALKKNTIQVYPLSAKQYVSGAWSDVVAMSYQNGEWVGWIRFVFANGVVHLGELSTSTPTRLYVENGVIKYSRDNTNGHWGYFTEMIDLTAVNAIKAKIKQSGIRSNENPTVVSVTSATPTAGGTAAIIARSAANAQIVDISNTEKELTVSVETLSGKYYIELAGIAVGEIIEISYV